MNWFGRRMGRGAKARRTRDKSAVACGARAGLSFGSWELLWCSELGISVRWGFHSIVAILFGFDCGIRGYEGHLDDFGGMRGHGSSGVRYAAGGCKGRVQHE